MVYVISLEGVALMPTTRYGKVRRMLKTGLAKVVSVKPFTIQLGYQPETEHTQEITLGIDSGYSNVGFSAVTSKKELLSGELKLLSGMKDRVSDRSMYRTNRRSRLRYRKPRWNNRTKSKPKGWLSPSIRHKLNSHVRFIDSIYKILPVTKCIVEVAAFDIQKIKNPEITGKEYQQGEQLGFWNTREYVLHRDGHMCQNHACKNKGSKNQILQIHHIKYKSLGGTDVPGNLITLCTKCHTSPNHLEGKFLYDWCQNTKKTRGFKDATFMSTIINTLVERLKEKHPNVYQTYGYITKKNRIENGIEKTHHNDAFVIAGGIKQFRNEIIHSVKQVRRNNRSLEKFYDAKYTDTRTCEKSSGKDLNCGRRCRNKNSNTENLHQYRGKKLSKGQRRIRKVRHFYQPNDLVRYNGKIYSVKTTQNKGAYIRLNGIKKIPGVKSITPYKFSKGISWL